MGIVDIERLYPIYRTCTDFCKVANLPFTFKEDLEDYETIIAIDGSNWYRPETTENWETVVGNVFCPDIIDFDNKIIIEFEEETGPRKPGAKYAKKGHGHSGDTDTVRDQKRNQSYNNAGFTVFRLWESAFKNENWKLQLCEFLTSCYKKSLEVKPQ